MGPAATVQGEVIRISGRIGREVEGNGSCNWDSDFRMMAKTFLALVRGGVALPAAQLGDVEGIVASLVKRHHGDTRRLAELAVAWVLLNPQPVRFDKPSYAR
jgi:hypothetical protein